MAMPHARFITHHLESVEMPITRPPLANTKLEILSEVRQAFINVRPIPPSSIAAMTQATLQEILELLKKDNRDKEPQPTKRFKSKNTHGKQPSDKKPDEGSPSSKCQKQ